MHLTSLQTCPISPMQVDCTKVDAKCQVFQLACTQTMMFSWKVPRTHCRPHTRQHSCKMFVWVPILYFLFSNIPHNLLEGETGVHIFSWMHSNCNPLSCFKGLFCLDLSTLFDYPKSDLDENWSCKFLVNLLKCFGACSPLGFVKQFFMSQSMSHDLAYIVVIIFQRMVIFLFPFSFYVVLVELVLKQWCDCILVLTMAPTSPYIPKHFHPLQGWCLWPCFSMASITWGSIDDSCHHPPLSHNPSFYTHWTSS